MLGVPVGWLAGLCLVPAVIFAFVWPDRPVSGVRWGLLRWGHAAVWLLLALSFALRAGAATRPAANPVALLALGAYLAFLAALITG